MQSFASLVARLLLTSRHTSIFVLLLGSVGFASVWYLDGVLGLEPCPLCIFQRGALALAMLLALVVVLINPVKTSLTAALAWIATVPSLAGVALALRHLWLQNLPDELKPPSCGGAGLEYLLDTLPLSEAVLLVLEGTGECANVQWRLLDIPGLSIPMLSLLLFSALTALWLLEALRRPILSPHLGRDTSATS